MLLTMHFSLTVALSLGLSLLTLWYKKRQESAVQLVRLPSPVAPYRSVKKIL